MELSLSSRRRLYAIKPKQLTNQPTFVGPHRRTFLDGSCTRMPHGILLCIYIYIYIL